MENLILTLVVGLVFGYIFYKIKVPGGMMVGAIIGVTTLNIFWGNAYMPSYAKQIAQITAGAFIGCTVEKSDLQRLKHIIKPAFVLLSSLLILNITLGFLIYYVSPLDLVTSLMSSVPGGLADIPIISADMGADAPKVVVLQFIRMITGIGLFPTLITFVARKRSQTDTILQNTDSVPIERIRTNEHTTAEFIQTMVVAIIFGVIGKMLSIPAGVLLFSLIGVISFKIIFDKAYMAMWAKRFAQVLAGAYIGRSMTYGDILELKYLFIPALLLLLGYFITCFIVGNLLSKYFGMSIKEGMLVATPAGASDMALISSDLGVQSTDLIVLQIIRVVVVISVFPQIINLIVKFLG